MSDTLPLDLNETKSEGDLPYASRGKRFANMIIDFVVYYILMFLFGIIIALSGNVSAARSASIYILVYLIFYGYFVVMESAFGQTIGKMITRTKVLTINNEKPSFANILGRSLCRFIPFDGISFLGSSGIGWHDSISKTKVVSLPKK